MNVYVHFKSDTSIVKAGWEAEISLNGPTCDPGYGVPVGTSTCAPCPAGTFGTGVGSCDPCPSGQYNPNTTMTECKHCPKGKVFNTSRSAANEMQVACGDCPPGKLRDNEIIGSPCTNCTRGKETLNPGTFTECMLFWMTDSTLDKYDSSPLHTHTHVGTNCTENHFKDNDFGEVCKRCPHGKYTDYEAAKTNPNMTGCMGCPVSWAK